MVRLLFYFFNMPLETERKSFHDISVKERLRFNGIGSVQMAISMTKIYNRFFRLGKILRHVFHRQSACFLCANSFISYIFSIIYQLSLFLILSSAEKE